MDKDILCENTLLTAKDILIFLGREAYKAEPNHYTNLPVLQDYQWVHSHPVFQALLVDLLVQWIPFGLLGRVDLWHHYLLMHPVHLLVRGLPKIHIAQTKKSQVSSIDKKSQNLKHIPLVLYLHQGHQQHQVQGIPIIVNKITKLCTKA